MEIYVFANQKGGVGKRLTKQQLDERKHIQQRRIQRSQDQLRDGVESEHRDRLRPSEHRPPATPGRSMGRGLLR